MIGSNFAHPIFEFLDSSLFLLSSTHSWDLMQIFGFVSLFNIINLASLSTVVMTCHPDICPWNTWTELLAAL